MRYQWSHERMLELVKALQDKLGNDPIIQEVSDLLEEVEDGAYESGIEDGLSAEEW